MSHSDAVALLELGLIYALPAALTLIGTFAFLVYARWVDGDLIPLWVVVAFPFVAAAAWPYVWAQLYDAVWPRRGP